MAGKDLGEKLLEDYADVFADIINVLIFRGERLLREEDIVDGPTASRYKDADANIREHVRDVVKYDKRKTTLALFGIENQSAVDSDMVFRVMGYDYSAYRKQMDADWRQRRSSWRGKRRRRRRRTKKYPVFTIILNFGMKRWDGPKDVISALDETLPYAKYYREAVSNPSIHVVDVAFLPKEVREQFTSDFRIVAEYFSALRENREKELRYNTQEILHVEAMLDFFRIFSGEARFEEYRPIAAKAREKGAVTMNSIFDYVEKEGREEGRKEKACEMARKMLKSGEPAAKIKKYTGLADSDLRALEKEG